MDRFYNEIEDSFFLAKHEEARVRLDNGIGLAVGVIAKGEYTSTNHSVP
jgi:hypothetical protein